MRQDLTDTDNVDDKISAVLKILENARRLSVNALDAAGGRGIELANKIDRIDSAIAALTGHLFCTSCEAQLTS